jgi:hypothetical protein
MPSPVDDGAILGGCRIDGDALELPLPTMKLMDELPGLADELPAFWVDFVGIAGRMAPDMKGLGLEAGAGRLYVGGVATMRASND